MGIKKVHEPGCNCCVCLVGTGATMSVTECSGTWSYPSSGTFSTASSNAKIIFDTDLTGPWRFLVSYSVSGTLSGTFSLLGGIDDPGTGYCNGTPVKMDITFSSALGITQWVLHESTGVARLGPGSSGCTCLQGTLGSALRMFWDGTRLHGGGNSDPTYWYLTLGSEAASFTGTRFGIETGTLTGGGTITFSNVALWRYGGRCPTTFTGCCEGPIPTPTLEFSNESGTMTSSGPTCTADCTLLGSYVMGHCTDFGVDCTWDVLCSWMKQFDIVFDCSGTPTNKTLRALASKNTADLWGVTVTGISGGYSGTVYEGSVTNSAPCSELGDLAFTQSSGDCTADVVLAF